MKNIVLILLAGITLFSCTEDITRNDPSFQGLKDDVLWRASGTTAVRDSAGGFSIEGARQFETLILRLPSTDEGTYVLGQNNNAVATFIIDNGMEEYMYSTGTGNPDAGEVTITEFSEETSMITGTFRFNAVVVDDNPLVAPILNFQSGVFYKIPVL